MYIEIHLEPGETLSNFNFAEAVTKICLDPDNDLDLMTVARMILVEEERRLMKIREDLGRCRKEAPHDS